MKTFFVKNLIVIFALFITTSALSYNLIAKSFQTVYWYEVNGAQIAGPISPDECPGGEDLCAIGFSRDFDIPVTLEEGLEDEDYSGVRTKP